jgi:Zn-dependent M16 (insulinase) family peptidase
MGQVLSSNYIHNEVREKGGAYGGSSSQNNGAFVFSSYRDPNVPNTLSVFKGALDWIESGKFTDDNIEEAKLSLFASLDGPEAPSRKGLQEFEYGIPDEARQKRRDGLFSTDRKKVVQVARKYLAKDALFSVAVFGAQESASQFTVEDGWQVRSE